jgi:hypothetical protein
MNVSHTNTDTNIPRVPQCMSSHWNWGPPLPLPPANVDPSPVNQRGGDARLRVRGWGSPNSDDWRKSRALSHHAETSFLVILPKCKKTRSSDLRLTSGGPLLRSLILQCVSQLQYGCQDAICKKKAISYSLAITRDAHNGNTEKSSGQDQLCLM